MRKVGRSGVSASAKKIKEQNAPKTKLTETTQARQPANSSNASRGDAHERSYLVHLREIGPVGVDVEYLLISIASGPVHIGRHRGGVIDVGHGIYHC